MERLVTKAGGNGPAVPTEIDMDFAFDLDKATFEGLQRIFNQLCAVTDILGDDYDIDRLRELIEADRDGRCVVLPVNPGDTVWSANSFGVSSHVIRRLERNKDGDFACSMLMFPFEDFGKKVFLTREEAKATLRRMQDDN